jgi:hypothetical protein
VVSSLTELWAARSNPARVRGVSFQEKNASLTLQDGVEAVEAEVFVVGGRGQAVRPRVDGTGRRRRTCTATRG